MFQYNLYKSPLLILVLTVQLLSGSLVSVRAADVTLDESQKTSECPKSKNKDSQTNESGILPDEGTKIAQLSDNLSQDNSGNLVAQLPDNGNSRPSESGCQVAGEDGCEISGEGGCEVGGPPAPAGGGILPAVAAAGGGLPLGLLAAPLGIIPFLGGDDDDDPSPEPIPEPSTVFGSVMALGVVTMIGRKRGFLVRRKRKK
jgi:hypothetical protein